MKKKSINLVVKGEVDFNGVTIKNIEGGFSEGCKVILAKDIAEIHEQPLKKINQLINDNIDEFEDGIDIIELKNNGTHQVPFNELGFSDRDVSISNNIYLLSEQGYLALAMLMRTPKSKEIRKQFRREYFRLREENKQLKIYEKKNNFTTKCLFTLECEGCNDDYELLMNNTVRNEVERVINDLGINAGVIAVKSNICQSKFSNWRNRKFNLKESELQSIVKIISKFKDLVD